jgi:GWxTD domain-containing protein
VRSSSICSATSRARAVAAGLLVAAAAFACQACASAAGGGAALVELVNPALGPDYSTWLVGPVARIASADERRTFLALRDDAAAAAFVQQFWERRNPGRGAGNPVLAAFDERREAADRKFSEGGVVGHQTDRGTILVLYGPPAKTGFEVALVPNQPGIEVWEYGAKAPAGLDGKQPDHYYRFSKRGDLTVFYTPRPGTQLGTPRTSPP